MSVDTTDRLDTVSYVYAVARPLDPAVLAEVRGVAGGQPHLVAHQDLVAVVDAVPAAGFDESALRARLENLDWLAAVARAHHAVVDTVARHTTALPLRLATVYHDDDRVHHMLADQHTGFTTALDRLTGRTEWGVKVYTDPTSPTPTETTDTGGGAGRAYLRRRLAQRQSTEDSWQRATDLSRRIDQELGDLAEDRRHHRPQDATLSGAAGDNVLNAAYLVTTERSAEFAARAREVAHGLTGVRVELTGPWVPYSFVPQHVTPDTTTEVPR